LPTSLKILLTGAKGQLGRELCRIDPAIDPTDKDVMDFSSASAIEKYCEGKHYDVIIHAGAVTNKFEEDADEEYIRSNIIGTANLVLWAKKHKIRLVYISTDYVYPSERGDYTEESVLLPVNRYAASTSASEYDCGMGKKRTGA
jgi:dTDP-4-dehydrorhamnose reductase